MSITIHIKQSELTKLTKNHILNYITMLINQHELHKHSICVCDNNQKIEYKLEESSFNKRHNFEVQKLKPKYSRKSCKKLSHTITKKQKKQKMQKQRTNTIRNINYLSQISDNSTEEIIDLEESSDRSDFTDDEDDSCISENEDYPEYLESDSSFKIEEK